MNNNWDQLKNRIISIKGLVAIGVGDIIGNAISALFWFYMATLLEPEQYGEIHYFLGIAGIASSLSLVGTLNTITVYTAKKIQIQSALYFVSLIISAISSLIVLIIFYRIDVVVVLIAYVINTLAVGDLLGRRLYSNYSKYVLAQKILSLVLGIGFYYIFGVDGIIFALALSYIFYTKRIYKGLSSKIDFSLLKPRLSFVMNNYLLSLLGGASGQVDKIIVAPLLGFVLLGNYSLAYQIIAMMMIFPQIMFKFFLSQDSSGIQNVKIKKITIFIAVVISLAGVILSPFIIPQFFPKYLEVIDAIQIMSFAVIPQTIGMIFSSHFLGLEKSRYLLTGTIISLAIYVGGIIFLGPFLGMIGLAFSFLSSSSAMAIFMFIVYCKMKQGGRN